jgi:hypothetical protein
MTQQARAFARGALWALPVWAALLFISTLTHQPDPQSDFPGFAAYVTTSQFLLSHLVGSIAGAAIGSIGVAAFAQTIMGRMFLAGQQNALDFYNQVYSAPLFGTALVGLLLLIIGGVFVGIAIAACGCLPRWTGWVYAVTTFGFVLSNFLFPVGQSVMSVLLLIATVVIAWSARRADHKLAD